MVQAVLIVELFNNINTNLVEIEKQELIFVHQVSKFVFAPRLINNQLQS
jgi:hypothetical protein